jgi:hypothetical protein
MARVALRRHVLVESPKGELEEARTHHCVRLFCIVDTLTITSMLPGVDDIIDEYPTGIARTGLAHACNMSGCPDSLVKCIQEEQYPTAALTRYQ